MCDCRHGGVRGWLADTLGGRRSVLVVDSNEAAARCSDAIRAELARLGHVAELGVPLRDGTFAGVGDVVAGRRVAWELAGYEGNRRGPVNRERYRVLAVREDGGLEVEVLDRRDHVLENRPADTTALTDDAVVRERMVLPPEYVAGHTTLAYAATDYAVQGATVQTSHTVATPNTSVNALYTGGSRGEASNTFHVATLTAPADPAQGEEHAVRRDPRVVLAAVFDTRESSDAANRSATAATADAEAWARSMSTSVERFADGVEQAVLERTLRHLDQLCAAELLGPVDRARIAAEDGTAGLARLLRQAELAGHDPRHVLREAVADSLDGARQVSDVIRGRIRTRTDGFDPTPSSWAGRVPADVAPDYAAYLAAIAGPLDAHTAELGARAAADPPPWLRETLSPVPPAIGDDGTDNRAAVAEWEARAGAIQAHRDLAGLPTTADPPDPESSAERRPGMRPARRAAPLDAADLLGSAPGRRQSEAYALYRDAHRGAALPDYTRDALEHSPAWHRACIRGWQREKQWGPAYVENMLAGTRQAEAHHRGEAELRRADAAAADAAGEPEQRDRLVRDATNADALADLLSRSAAELEQLSQERGRFLARTAKTRAQSDASEAYLGAQGLRADPDDLTTGEEWLALDRQARADDDPHRPITGVDLTEHDERADQTEDPADGYEDGRQVDADTSAAVESDAAPERAEHPDQAGDAASGDEQDSDGPPAAAPPTPESPEAEPADEPADKPGDELAEERADEPVGENTAPDVRDLATAERDGLDEDTVHVPDADETARARRLARDAAIEWRNRAALDARHEADEQESERDAQLARWHDQDQGADHGDAGTGDARTGAHDAVDDAPIDVRGEE